MKRVSEYTKEQEREDSGNVLLYDAVEELYPLQLELEKMSKAFDSALNNGGHDDDHTLDLVFGVLGEDAFKLINLANKIGEAMMYADEMANLSPGEIQEIRDAEGL